VLQPASFYVEKVPGAPLADVLELVMLLFSRLRCKRGSLMLQCVY
jgi:hypothetical protein